MVVCGVRGLAATRRSSVGPFLVESGYVSHP